MGSITTGTQAQPMIAIDLERIEAATAQVQQYDQQGWWKRQPIKHRRESD